MVSTRNRLSTAAAGPDNKPREPEYEQQPPRGKRMRSALAPLANAAQTPALIISPVAALPSLGPTTRKKAKAASSSRQHLNTESATIGSLSDACLLTIFEHCTDDEHRRKVLPLVCSRWAALLKGSSSAWKHMRISMHGYPSRTLPLWHDPACYWILNRLQSIEKLNITYDQIQHWAESEAAYPSPQRAITLRRILKSTAPSLKELQLILPDRINLKLENVLTDLSVATGLTYLRLARAEGRLTPAATAPLAKLTSLRRLELCAMKSAADRAAGEPIEALPFPPAILTLTGLEGLKLYCDTIEAVPSEIHRLSRLENLDICNSTLVKDLPLEFAFLGALSKLSIAGTSIGESSQSWRVIARLPQLQELDASGCGCTTLDHDLGNFNIGFSLLTKLDLSTNAFGPIVTNDSILEEMEGLRDLMLAGCHLATIPDDVVEYLTELTSLNVSKNELVDLPQDMVHLNTLQELLAAENSFPCIPEVLSRLNSLRFVDFSGCDILEVSKSLGNLPEELPLLKDMYLMKGSGRWQKSSRRWLDEAAEEFEKAGRGRVILREAGV